MAFPAFSHDHFLSPLRAFSLSFSSFCDFDADQLERMKQLFIFTLISVHLVVLDDPVFPLQRA